MTLGVATQVPVLSRASQLMLRGHKVFWLFWTLAVSSAGHQAATPGWPPISTRAMGGLGTCSGLGTQGDCSAEGSFSSGRGRGVVVGFAGQGGCQEGVGGLSWPQSLWEAAASPLPQGMDFRGHGHWRPCGVWLGPEDMQWPPQQPGRWAHAVAQPWQHHHGPGNAQGLGRAVPAPRGTGRWRGWQGWHTMAEHIVLHISIADVGQTLGGICAPSLCPTSERSEGVPWALLTCPFWPGHLAEMPSLPQGCTRVSGHTRV